MSGMTLRIKYGASLKPAPTLTLFSRLLRNRTLYFHSNEVWTVSYRDDARGYSKVFLHEHDKSARSNHSIYLKSASTQHTDHEIAPIRVEIGVSWPHLVWIPG